MAQSRPGDQLWFEPQLRQSMPHFAQTLDLGIELLLGMSGFGVHLEEYIHKLTSSVHTFRRCEFVLLRLLPLVEPPPALLALSPGFFGRELASACLQKSVAFRSGRSPYRPEAQEATESLHYV